MNFPLFLQAIKGSIKSKKLSIAVPGKGEDMMAFNDQTSKTIFDAVDYVNVSFPQVYLQFPNLRQANLSPKDHELRLNQP